MRLSIRSSLRGSFRESVEDVGGIVEVAGESMASAAVWRLRRGCARSWARARGIRWGGCSAVLDSETQAHTQRTGVKLVGFDASCAMSDTGSATGTVV